MWEIKFYARGGQGAVTAADILTNAAIIEGKFAQSIPSYGQERKGAPVYAFARIDDKEIETKSYVYRPNCVMVFDMGLEELGIDIYEGLVSGSAIVANTLEAGKINNKNLSKIASIDANGITNLVVGDVPPNVAMLGALSKLTKCVSIESLEKAILTKIKGKAGELNAKACRRAYEETIIHEKA
ncbi:2-oxoacid:acceptor oxidoreductase family protein [Tissierella praeacuta]|uniref:2-oxoacid:acceptor oxidoreductase family protein n=1 Tax=Tissierella praeacuta TaxID=43131 RepID=UPI003341F70A